MKARNGGRGRKPRETRAIRTIPTGVHTSNPGAGRRLGLRSGRLEAANDESSRLKVVDEQSRLELAARHLPTLIRAAREIHGRDRMRVVAAVLSAWGDLAGITGWTPGMIERVEKAMGGR